MATKSTKNTKKIKGKKLKNFYSAQNPMENTDKANWVVTPCEHLSVYFFLRLLWLNGFAVVFFRVFRGFRGE